MRRFKQLLPDDEAKKILTNATNGIISLTDVDGEPYGVPLSFAYDGDRSIYFHCASTGHKLDCLRHDHRCSFCVVAQDHIVPEEFTTYFRSVIVKGNIFSVSDPDEIRRGLLRLCEKYSPGIDCSGEINKCMDNVKILRMDITGITGKEAIELVRAANR